MSTIFQDKDNIDTIVPPNLSTNAWEATWWPTIPCLTFVSKLKSFVTKTGTVLVCLTTDRMKITMEEQKMNNEKGFGLLEVLASIVILAIVMEALMVLLGAAYRSQAKLNKTIVQAQSITNPVAVPKFVIIRFANLGECHTIDGYFAARIDSRSVMVYTDSQCKAALGTLGALTNETYFNDLSPSMWMISGDTSTLRIVVMKGMY